MTALRLLRPVPDAVALLDLGAGEAIAAVPHAPPTNLPAAPRRQHAPVTAIVAALQSELGIRTQRLGSYGPTSALSEALLWRGYGLEGER